MTITIRLEEPKDYRLVEEITREAFWNLYVPGANEHYLTHHIRKHQDFIPELTFVIELEGKIIGSIIYTHAKIIDKNGMEYPIISFGPVSILPELHRQGFGRLLIEHSIKEAKKLGYKGIVIGGYPDHYNTYGFLGSKKYQLSMPDGKYYIGIMALPLIDNFSDEISSGSIYFSEAMYPDEASLVEFDKTFPTKEKKIHPSQLRFQKVSQELDETTY